MEHKKESVEEVFARVFRAPVKRREELSSPEEPNSPVPAPGLTRELPPAVSPKDLAEAMEIVRAWLMLGNMALSLTAFIVRNKEKMTPDQHKNFLATLNKTLDVMEPLSGVVNVTAKYCAKLQAAELGVEKMLDSIDDLLFAREVRAELALMD